jgi:hypothetical protein
MVLAPETRTSLSEAFALTSSAPGSSLGSFSCAASASTLAWVVAVGQATWSRATERSACGEAMHPSFTKRAVLDDLTARLATRRRQAREGRAAYEHLARAIVRQPQTAGWPGLDQQQPRPVPAAA